MTRPFRQNRSLRRARCAVPLAAILACVALVLPACKRNRQNLAALPADTSAASPAVRGAVSGLEVWWWTVADRRPEPSPVPNPDGSLPPPPRFRIVARNEDLNSILAPYVGRPLPISDEQREQWRAAGLRLIAVPASHLDRLQERMRLIGQVQRQWLGELTDWTDVVRGPSLTAPRAVAVEGGTLLLDPGRPALMARCWSVPIPGAGGQTAAALRLELVPQHLPPDDPERRWRTAAGLEPDDPGLRFDRFALGALLTNRDEAYLITTDLPEADWSAPAAAPEEPAPAVAGPVPDRAPTFGEVLLSTPATKTQGRLRAVIVLVPRIPERFNLLP